MVINMIRIAVCDDDKTICSLIKKYVQEYNLQYKTNYLLDEFSKGEQLLEAYNKQYHILILDVELSDGNGIDLAKYIRNVDENVIIIFSTAYLHYAPRGYEVNAYRYLLKPYSYNQFAKELKMASEMILKNKEEILIRCINGNYRIVLKNILYVESFGHKLAYHMTNGKVYEAISTLKELLEQDCGQFFIQVHKSFIVNKEWILHFDNRNVYLKEDVIIPISKHRLKEFRQEYLKYWGNKIR